MKIKERKIRKNDYCDKKIKNNTFFLDKKYYLNNIFERDNVTTLTNNNIWIIISYTKLELQKRKS